VTRLSSVVQTKRGVCEPKNIAKITGVCVVCQKVEWDDVEVKRNGTENVYWRSGGVV